MAFVYLNGEIVPEDKAMVSVDDRSVLFGDAAYETMRSYSGRFFRFPDHLRRLRDTLEGMRLELPVSDADITRGARDLLEANALPDARVRLTVTGGRFRGEIRLRRTDPPNLILTARPLSVPDPAVLRTGVSVTVSPWRVHSVSPLPRIKTVNRLRHLMAKEDALAAGAWDALFCDEAGNLLEGTATNVFFVVEGVLCTPSLDGPLLAGVTRDAVLELARKEEVPLREGPLPLVEAADAGEGFLTSTTIELLPVTALDGKPVGEGRPGPVWRTLAAAYRRLVAEETGVPQPGLT
jgi:branched-subunit amino acid aminotransferase/4-amino-4-deoxychorismate lyase